MIDPEKVYHVLPCNDLKKHFSKCIYPIIGEPYCPCECEPVFKEVEGGTLIVHNSFDGREGVEWVNAILNEKK